MKRSAFLLFWCLVWTFSAFGLFGSSAQADGQGKEPVWILNHGDAFSRAVVNQGDLMQQLGLTMLRTTGSDTTFSIPMEEEEHFSAEERPFLAFRYRMKTKQKIGGLFFTTDTLQTLSDESFTPFPVLGDGQWRDLIFDMRTAKHGNWKGTVTSFRLDPINPSDLNSEIEISRLGFFPSEETAKAFLAEAHDLPDYAQDTILSRHGVRCLIPGGTLSDGWKETEFLFERTPEHVEAARSGTSLTVCCDGKPVPSCVNRRGFVWYIAEKAGRYTLEKVSPERPAVPLPEAVAERFGCRVSTSFPPEYFTRERIRIGGWGSFNPQYFDERQLQDFRDCGFDLLIATNGAAALRHRGMLFRECDRLGIEVYINDGGWHHPETAGEEYFDHPSFCGHYITDEPGTDSYPRFGKVCEDYAKATGKVPYINLLPMYANAAQLKFGAHAAAIEYYDPDPELYRKYCESYCDLVPTDYICTDIYPLNWRNGLRYTYSEYIESINVIASVARERKKEFWCCIQTFGWIPSKRTPNAAEFRWQCYSLLSFGARGILCWTYARPNPERTSLLDYQGNRMPAWFDARTVFQELRNISDVFCRYRNLGAFTHNASEKVPYLRMTNEYRDFETIRGISCPDPLLIGCFAKEEDEKDPYGTAFTLVNMTELEAAQSTLVKLRLNAKKVTSWRRGIPEVQEPDKDGFYVFPLETGEGVFVTCE